jgi:probable F420-dependent oxidoreductase
MRFSIWPLYTRPWDELLTEARHVEAAGWHGLWYADHYMPDSPTGDPVDGPVHECWTMLPALGAAVPRLRLGSLVSPTTVHHPALLAKRAASLDHLTGGRLVLGLGAGWQVNEHRAYGFDLLEPKDRVDRFEEGIQIVRSLLREPRTTFAGKHFQVTDAPCDPKPVQDPLPILVGSGSPRMLRITARFADEWNTWGTPERVAEVGAALDRACEAEGRDPGTLRRTCQAMVSLQDDPSVAETVRGRLPAERSIVGSAAELVDRLGAYAEAGIDEFIVPDFTLGRTEAERLETIDRVWEELAAPFR